MTEDEDTLGMSQQSEPTNREFRRLNAELLADRDFVAAMLDATESIVVVLDASQRIVRANGAFERILGYGHNEANGQLLSTIFNSAAPAEDTPQGEDEWRAKDGTSHLIAWATTALAPGQTILTGNDITERKRAEDRRVLSIRVEAAQREAEANRTKDEFLATLSHEFRTPLNAILGWTQILRSRRLDEVTMVRAYEAIERNAKMQAELIEDMLDISRIITGRLRLDMQPVVLTETVECALESARPMAEAKGVGLEYERMPEDPVVSGDQRRLQQIVSNLLSNAVKFTPSPGLVRVTLTCTTSEARLIVSDTGKGIDPKFLPFIFERFRQAETMISRTSGGLGLGLSIARDLVELHGGTIAVSSEGEGRGSTFTVTFPLSEAISTAAVQNAS
jgi:PAS domain S-box-containing protein